MKCSVCKNDIPGNAIFCSQCGTRIETESHIAQPLQRIYKHYIGGFWHGWAIEEKLMSEDGIDIYRAVRNDGSEEFATLKVIEISSDTIETEFSEKGIIYKKIINCVMNEIYMLEAFRENKNIVNIDEFKIIEKSTDGECDIYIRMDSVVPLNLYIADKFLSEQDVIKLGCDICTALEACEKRKIVQSDINVESIFVDKNNNYVLGNFKIESNLVGIEIPGHSSRNKMNFVAPEVLKSIKHTPKVDIYSLGMVMYSLLNRNRPPFISLTKQILTLKERKEAVRRRLDGEDMPPPVDAGEKLSAIILKACAFNSEERYNSATEMKEALMAIRKNTYKPAPEPEAEKEAEVFEKVTENSEIKEKKPKGIKRFFHINND